MVKSNNKVNLVSQDENVAMDNCNSYAIEDMMKNTIIREKIGVVPNRSEDGRILSQVDWASYEDLLNHTLMRRIDQMENIPI
jgi:hypothetical protein